MEKQRLRFQLSDEIILLREVLRENPFFDTQKWKTIHTKVNLTCSKSFSVRSLRDHVHHLMVNFIKEDNINRKKSGTEEECTELKILLQDVVDLSKEFAGNRNKKNRQRENAGIIAREESLAVLGDCVSVTESDNIEFIVQDNDSLQQIVNLPITNEEVISETVDTTQVNHSITDSRIRRKKPSLLNYIKQRQEQEQTMRKAELELQTKKIRLDEAALELEKNKLRLEEDKLNFEKYKFDVETKERELRLKMDMEERQDRLQGEREQRQMLLSVINSIVGQQK